MRHSSTFSRASSRSKNQLAEAFEPHRGVEALKGARPSSWLFPGPEPGDHVSVGALQSACRAARRRARIGKRRTATLTAASSLAALSTRALAAKRAPERTSLFQLAARLQFLETPERGDHLLTHLIAVATALNDLQVGAPGRGLAAEVHGGSACWCAHRAAIRAERSTNISEKRGTTFSRKRHLATSKINDYPTATRSNCRRWSGRIEARFGLADVSSIPPIIPYGEFSPVRLEGWLSKPCLPG
jgi:hypothetical protein